MRYLIGLTFIGLGVFTLTAGVFVRVYVAPHVVAAPTDVYRVARLNADDATYFDAGAMKMHKGAHLTATSTVRGDVASSHDGIAVWDATTVIQDLTGRSTLEIRQVRVAFDRRTGLLTNCCGASVQGDTSVEQTGIGLFWPLKVERRDYRLFDVVTKRAWPVRYDGRQTVNGVRTYRFVQEIPLTRLADKVPDVPGGLLGLKGKAAGSAIPVDRYAQTRSIYWIDPRSGAPIDQETRVVSTLGAKKGPGRLVVADMVLHPAADTRRTMKAGAEAGARKIRLVEEVVPLVCVIAGSLITVIGAPLSRRRPAARHRGQLDETPIITG